MADTNVLKAQKYLNAMFGGHANWVHLEEDGNTGTATIRGIIRAFQIQNNIDVVGEAGPATLTKMKSLPKISKMQTTDEPLVNVCLLQCALFCKGYAAGGITGIYYTSGVSAVEQLQNDANIGVTGIVDWKVWSALLSFNWFTEPYNPFLGYDATIRTIQQQLNYDYADYLNVRACDGIMSRETALSLIGALQVEEGILSSATTITNLNELNFGEKTISSFPGILKIGNTYTKINKIIQYGLYFNGYNPGNFDGNFDENTQAAVSNFQEFYGLLGIINDSAGEVGYQTMMSLLISRGDTQRPAFACDCSVVLNSQQIADLKAAHYQIVGRYLTGTVGGTDSKALTVAELQRIADAGLRVFPIYQDGGYYLDYFKNEERGMLDALNALEAARRLGIPWGSTIYFAVDFDCLPQDTENYIINYFEQINAWYGTLFDATYKVGVYGPRQVCNELARRGLSSSSFVSDMSRGFTGNCGYALPSNWAFDQFAEITFSSSPSFNIDKDAISPDPTRDKGCLTFETVSDITDDERVKAVFMKHLRKFTSVTAPITDIFNYDYDFADTKIPIAEITSGNLVLKNYIASNSTLSVHPDSGGKNLVTIEFKDGELTANFKELLGELLAPINAEPLQEVYEMVHEKALKIADEMRYGDIYCTFKITSPKSFEIAVGWESDKVYIPSNEDGEQAKYLSLNISWVTEISYNSDDYESPSELVNVILFGGALAASFLILNYMVAADMFYVGTATKVTAEVGSLWAVITTAGFLETASDD